jgi:hypothetical protein
MNYADVTDLALVYSDRTNDAELISVLPKLVSLVEARINKVISSYSMSTRQSFTLDDTTLEYTLPSTIGQGINSLKVTDTASSAVTAVLTRVPQTALDVLTANGVKSDMYTVENGKIRLLKPYGTGCSLVIDFLQSVPSLFTDGPNWLSDLHGDCYVFGLVTEIYAYTKNAAGYESWNARFNESLNNIELNSDSVTWSNMPLITRVG